MEAVMVKTDITPRRTDTILEELERLRQAVSQRAFDMFQARGSWGDALTDWLTAEHQLVWRPAVALREKNGQFEVLAALSGVDAKDLDVRITPDDLLIQADTRHGHTEAKGTVHFCEFEEGRLFRSVHFPEKVDPESARAEYRNGMLRLTAAIAKKASAPQTVDIKAA
jgi:HSP20 family protein